MLPISCAGFFFRIPHCTEKCEAGVGGRDGLETCLLVCAAGSVDAGGAAAPLITSCGVCEAAIAIVRLVTLQRQHILKFKNVTTT